MTFQEYQSAAKNFAIYPEATATEYLGLGLASEAGEVAGKIKKRLRGDHVSDRDIVSELGDVLWYMSELSRNLGYSLEEIANINIEKLSSRKTRGKIQGSGDDR